MTQIGADAAGLRRKSWAVAAVGLLCLATSAVADVSYHRDIAPMLSRHCNGCHRPGKEKGGIDLTTAAGVLKGGKHGPGFVAGDPQASQVIVEVSGPDPAMPKDGDRLSPAQVGMLERWIREGGRDDSPPPPPPRTEPPTYLSPPVLGALAFSADGRWLAVAGWYETLVFDAVTLERKHRWVGAPARTDALRFSPDSTRLAVVGGEPGLRGELQIWGVASGRAELRLFASHDSLLGCDWSPDGGRVAVGGADRMVRVFDAATGGELMRATAHTDWVLGVVFVGNGRHLVSGGRDRSLRLLDAGDGRMLDVLNKDTEPVVQLLRVPGVERVAFAGSDSRARIYKAEPRPPTTDPGQDPNFVREFDAFGDGTTAIGVSSDGGRIAVAGQSPEEVRVHDTGNGRRLATFKDLGGAAFGLAFDPSGERLAAAGFDGQVRVFEVKSGRLLTNFCPVEITGRVATGK